MPAVPLGGTPREPPYIPPMRTLLTAFALLLAACSGEGPAPEVIHVDPSEASALAQAGVTVLDVRTPQERAGGVIPGSVGADWNGDFRAAIQQLDRDRPLVVTCESGRRSTAALDVLAEEGFEDVAHLDGGMRAWRAAGLPTEAP